MTTLIDKYSNSITICNDPQKSNDIQLKFQQVSDLFHHEQINLENNLPNIKSLPFYSGGEFKLPTTQEEYDSMIITVLTNMKNEWDPNSYQEAKNTEDDLENNNVYKQNMIRGMVVIHWWYIGQLKGEPVNRVEFIDRIIKKVTNSYLRWGFPDVLSRDILRRVYYLLSQGKELTDILNAIPLKALSIYGW